MCSNNHLIANGKLLSWEAWTVKVESDYVSTVERDSEIMFLATTDESQIAKICVHFQSCAFCSGYEYNSIRQNTLRIVPAVNLNLVEIVRGDRYILNGDI